MNFFSLFKRKLIYKLRKKVPIDDFDDRGKSLDSLFHFYGSDKANIFKTRNDKGHGFTNFYLKHLKSFEGNNLNILEIGSYAGASAAAFVKYFDRTKVFCFDVNISNFKYKSENIQVFGLDIKNKQKVDKIIKEIFLKNNFENFDIIIDDGSHKLSDILLSINNYFRYLKNNGLYIIEDFKHPNYYSYNRDIDHILIDKFLEKLKNKETFISSILNEEDQKKLIYYIKKIYVYKGNLHDSDICFIEKN